MATIERALIKIKYTAFGKVKSKGSKMCKSQQSMSNEEILENQRFQIEKGFKKVQEISGSKGKTAAIFDVLNSVRGGRKQGTDLVAMRDPVTSDLIVDPDILKQTTLDYCSTLLQSNKVHPEYTQEIYIENLVHYLRCLETATGGDDNLDYSDFETRIKTVTDKCRDKYKFLTNAGTGLRNCLYQLFSKVWETEEKPQQWRNTVIVQLYKSKGDPSDFNNQRNIHTKDFIPKLFEGILVQKTKDLIISSVSKFQIGGMPGHRPQEHLFCVKSVIALYTHLKLPLYIQLFDISKYFDKEILKDAMDTLYKCGVRGKVIRRQNRLHKQFWTIKGQPFNCFRKGKSKSSTTQPLFCFYSQL